MYSTTTAAVVVVERGQIDDRCLVDVFEPPLSVETPIDQHQWKYELFGLSKAQVSCNIQGKQPTAAVEAPNAPLLNPIYITHLHIML